MAATYTIMDNYDLLTDTLSISSPLGRNDEKVRTLLLASIVI
jgi:hypothetical protein